MVFIICYKVWPVLVLRDSVLLVSISAVTVSSWVNTPDPGNQVDKCTHQNTGRCFKPSLVNYSSGKLLITPGCKALEAQTLILVS